MVAQINMLCDTLNSDEVDAITSYNLLTNSTKTTLQPDDIIASLSPTSACEANIHDEEQHHSRPSKKRWLGEASAIEG